ncbi:RNA-binding cell elongation regulator Jag/EloR [Thermotoga profunda]|uniref:RNA-binding cell elongation regulator Jag/EloR n=1 Tax=Thermotoga profunda TaxID=1508420 RepID=UPI00059798DE|nr:RNA-binding cell elongation regulator Jag/EloR [Thermotoga profunda]
MKKLRATGPTVTEAIEKVKQQFDLMDEEFDYTVIEKGSKGFFGLMAKEAVVEITIKNGFYKRKLEQFMNHILSTYGDINVNVQCVGKKFSVELEGKDLGRLIGKHGKTLAALQHIATIYLNRLSDTKLSVIVDAGEYRERRKKSLEHMVKQVIENVRTNKGKVILDPMFSFERRVVHEIAKNYCDIKSYSIGIEPYRKVVIEYCPDSKESLRPDQNFKSSVRGS